MADLYRQVQALPGVLVVIHVEYEATMINENARYHLAPASPGYEGVWDGPDEMSAAAIVARLNAQDGAVRQAGADVVALVNAASAYLAVMTWSPSKVKNWKAGDPIPDYRTPEKRLRKILAGPARPHVELLADLIEPAKTINDLRAQLDTALSHIAALLADCEDGDIRINANRFLQR